MAICVVCGTTNRRLPSEWLTWECEQCYDEAISDICGTFDPDERLVVGEHASALGVDK